MEMTWIPPALLGFAVGIVTFRLLYLRWKQQRIEERRVVEQPNSHYASKAVRDLEDRERWERMDLDRLHELNREEAVRLLERVRVLGAESLKSDERAFLDRMEAIAPQRG